MTKFSSPEDLGTVSELVERKGQTPEAWIKLLSAHAVPHYQVGDEVFFAWSEFWRVFSPDSTTAPSSTASQDERERLAVIADIEAIGFRLYRRRGTRAMELEMEVVPGADIYLDLLSDDPESVRLTPDGRHAFKVYVAKNALRNVAHFTVTGFQREELIDSDSADPGVLYLFRAAKLRTTFLRTQRELTAAWLSLRRGSAPTWKGVRLHGLDQQGLHLTFSPTGMIHLQLANRLQKRSG